MKRIDAKKVAERLAPLLARYDGEPVLFGSQIKKAIELVKKIRKEEQAG